MAWWHIDVGFDWDAVTQQGTFNGQTVPIAYLQQGFVQPTGSGPPFAGGINTELNNVKPGDKVSFYVYDVTGLNDGSGPSGASPQLSPGTSWITWRPADDNTSPSGSPFSNGSALQNSGLNNIGLGSSTTFNNQSFPAWAVAVTGTVPSTAITTPNNWLFTLTFPVTGTQNGQATTIYYQVDPEMIVQPGG